jgi:hypothetical protein
VWATCLELLAMEEIINVIWGFNANRYYLQNQQE